MNIFCDKLPRKYFKRGVIYTTNLEKGKAQLQKIIDKKKTKGIHYDLMRQSQYGVDVYFDDMTWWHIALNFESVRGIRWVDAYIDEDISIKFLKEITLIKKIKETNLYRNNQPDEEISDHLPLLVLLEGELDG